MPSLLDGYLILLITPIPIIQMFQNQRTAGSSLLGQFFFRNLRSLVSGIKKNFNKYLQFKMGLLVQVENRDKQAGFMKEPERNGSYKV